MYVAFLELWVAARTDPELQRILTPGAGVIRARVVPAPPSIVFPEWRDSGENFDVALDLVHYVMDGMAVSFPTHEHGEHEKRLLAYLERQMATSCRAGKITDAADPPRPRVDSTRRNYMDKPVSWSKSATTSQPSR
mgnify:CR=1 FL=1